MCVSASLKMLLVGESVPLRSHCPMPPLGINQVSVSISCSDFHLIASISHQNNLPSYSLQQLQGMISHLTR